MRSVTVFAVLAFAGVASAQTSGPPASGEGRSAIDGGLVTTPPSVEIEPVPARLTSLETEACRRLILEQAAGPKPGTAEITGATVGGVAGQAAGATVGGPWGAAVGGLVVGRLGQGAAGLVRKVFGASRSAGKDRDRPAAGEPDPQLVAECDARDPELRALLTAKR